MKTKKKINPEAINLLTSRGFEKKYFENLGRDDLKTNKEAYEETENTYKKYFGKYKYSNWDSFRRVKNNRMKSQKK